MPYGPILQALILRISAAAKNRRQTTASLEKAAGAECSSKDFGRHEHMSLPSLWQASPPRSYSLHTAVQHTGQTDGRTDGRARHVMWPMHDDRIRKIALQPLRPKIDAVLESYRPTMKRSVANNLFYTIMSSKSALVLPASVTRGSSSSSCIVPLQERCCFHDFTPQFTVICSVPGRPQTQVLMSFSTVRSHVCRGRPG